MIKPTASNELRQKNTKIDVNTRLIKGKILMFAKLSLKSFVL